jgi:hypothetical protein
MLAEIDGRTATFLDSDVKDYLAVIAAGRLERGHLDPVYLLQFVLNHVFGGWKFGARGNTGDLPDLCRRDLADPVDLDDADGGRLSQTRGQTKGRE